MKPQPEPKNRKDRQSVSHLDLLSLAVKLSPQKEDLQKRFDQGLSASQLARELNIPFTTLRTILTHIGVDWNQRGYLKTSRPDRLSAEVATLRKAIIRIASELNINIELNGE